MNLPIIIDIAVGLILSYLMLSLLASEIQELLSTLLQWRAVHLKESIEGFLSGNNSGQMQDARLLANRLYAHPTIQSLTHEAKGLWARLPRLLTWIWPMRIFGDRRTGPSYIGSQAFAQSLMDVLGLDVLIQKLTVLRIQNQMAQILGPLDYSTIAPKLRSSIRAYENGRMTLDEVIRRTAEDVKGINQTLFEQQFATDLQKQAIANQLAIYVVDILQASYIFLSLQWRAKLAQRAIELVASPQSPNPAPAQQATARLALTQTPRPTTPAVERSARAPRPSRQTTLPPSQLAGAIKRWTDVPASIQRTLLLIAIAWQQHTTEVNFGAIAQLPSSQLQSLGLTEADLERLPQAELFYKSLLVQNSISQAIEGEIGVDEVEVLFQELRDRGDLPDMLDNALDQTLSVLAFIVTHGEVRSLVQRMPLGVLEGLQTPARQVQIQIDNLHQQISQFQTELAVWFDRSMERASGVYKRNARLVSFCLGMAIAVGSNTDTFHMVQELAQEPVLRATVNDLVEKLPESQAFDAEGNPNLPALEALTDGVYPTLPLGWSDRNLVQQARRDGVAVARDGHIQITPQFVGSRALGWLVTGIAIAMGAGFWYDVLSKFINIKNVGAKPPKAANDISN